MGEFVVMGKLVTTFFESRERAHLETPGDRALLYRSAAELARHLQEYRPQEMLGTECDKYAEPDKVMEIFLARFLTK